MPLPHVLQVVLSLNPGGTERLVVEIVKRLHADIPMAVCCLDEPGEWAGELTATGVEVTSLARQPGFHPSLGRGVAHAARRHHASVLHAHQYTPMADPLLARIWNPNTSVVFTEHGRLSNDPATSKRRVANRLLRRFPSQVFAVSEGLKEYMVESGFSGNLVEVIYNGIDAGPAPDSAMRPAVRRRLGVSDDTFVVATIARLDPVKDLGTAIRAIREVAAQMPAALVVVGDGPERQHLETIAAQSGAGAHVIFLGHQDPARQWLAGCDAYVNCSLSEGVSLTILEAMAAALPVVATRVGGTPEVIDDTCGRLIPAGDVTAQVNALLELALDPSLRRALGHAGRERVETRFTLDRMVREYRDVYLGAA